MRCVVVRPEAGTGRGLAAAAGVELVQFVAWGVPDARLLVRLAELFPEGADVGVKLTQLLDAHQAVFGKDAA